MSQTIRRINLIGGPGTGKSGLSGKLFSHFKSEGYSTELCHEYVKDWVYQNRNVESFDQVYILGKQMQREFLPLKAGVQLVITDCPLFLSYYYSMEVGNDELVNESIYNLTSSFDVKYPSLNVFLKRSFPFNPEGRFHSEEEAKEVDKTLLYLLNDKEQTYIMVDPASDDCVEKIYNEFLYNKWSVV